LVLTGLPSDYRDVENRRLSQFFQECAQLGITEQVHFLGHVPYEDMISLMRCATLVIQPSLFEGWNTTIEDAKALGRPLICSDIPVHREQAPDALGFFEPTSAADLAHLIGSRYPQLDAGPGRLAEVEALSRSKAQAAAFGRSLLSLAREAFEISTATHSDTLVPNLEPPTLAASPQEKKNQLREYLAQKKRHLRYLFGKLIFRLTYWHETIELLRNFLCELTQKCHGHELGVMRQHSGRPLRIEKFSMPKAKRLQLPTIAMVTPSYDQADALSATIDSVVKQDYPGLEYAVVDRGSRDGTEEVLTQFKSKLTFSVSEADVGPAQAMVKGFARLQGEIMSCLNAGNVLMPGALFFVGDYFAAHPDVEVIYGHRIIVDEQGQEVGRWILPRHERETLRYFNYVPEETLYWRKSIYDRVGGINPTFQIAIAWDLLLRFAAAGAQIRRVPYGLACFRIRPGPKTKPPHDTGAERERLRLLSREHPNGYTAEIIQEQEHWYRLRSSLCATLLKAGIRF
ncbi:MAG TPA: glycosyltransferase, partial [Terrimicrobiaceae bacterium]